MAAPEDAAPETYIQWLCNREGHQFLCEVDTSYIEDTFNLYGLRTVIPHFRDCLDTILDCGSDSDPEPEEWSGHLYNDARDLYGMIHARFILTGRGINQMHAKFNEREFGVCPRVYCNRQPVMPVGLSDELRKESVKVFCPSCQDIYRPADPHIALLDGAYFGTTFPHLFFLTKPQLVPSPPSEKYVPKIYGFKIFHPSHLKTARGAPGRPRIEGGRGSGGSTGAGANGGARGGAAGYGAGSAGGASGSAKGAGGGQFPGGSGAGGVQAGMVIPAGHSGVLGPSASAAVPTGAMAVGGTGSRADDVVAAKARRTGDSARASHLAAEAAGGVVPSRTGSGGAMGGVVSMNGVGVGAGVGTGVGMGASVPTTGNERHVEGGLGVAGRFHDAVGAGLEGPEPVDDPDMKALGPMCVSAGTRDRSTRTRSRANSRGRSGTDKGSRGASNSASGSPSATSLASTKKRKSRA